MHIFHFFIPHRKNNHRAKLLHNVSLFVLIIAVGFTSVFSAYIYKTAPQVLGISYQISDVELLNLTNYERVQNGLPPLSLSRQLSSAAQKKGQHMFQNDYWAHFAPDGTTPWEIIKGEGYNYTFAGENLAKGFTTSHDAVKAWMKSPTHKENILSENYEEVGFSIAEGKLQGEDTVLIVQEFGSRVGGIDPNDVAPLAQKAAPEVHGSYEGIPPTASFQSITKNPSFDISLIAKALTFILLASLLVALVLDFIIIEKKKIPRVVGHNLDHIILITIFTAFLFVARLGHIV